jgi:hypothetical protein
MEAVSLPVKLQPSEKLAPVPLWRAPRPSAIEKTALLTAIGQPATMEAPHAGC